MKYRASKLTIREVTTTEERDFLEAYHYQGYFPSKLCFGLYDENELIELMSFGKPRFNHFYSWELLRLCTKADTIVYGGASKLFKHFLSLVDIGNGVLSYCNRDKFDGKVYKALGFVSNGIKKGYKYEKNGVVYHRSAFTRAILEKLYPQYPRDLYTEADVMRLEGFTRIDDKIGQETFIFGDKAKMYVYKITFDDGKTYVGQHIQYKENDGYVTSSKYAENHKIQNREILFYAKDRFTLDLIESVCILDDKANGTNVNGNYGNYFFSHPCNVGIPRNYYWTDATREKFRKTMTGHTTSEETKEKISIANKGKVRTQEQREHISEAHKGYVMPEEQKQKISKSMKGGNSTSFKKGHTMSDEIRKKISETAKAKGIRPKLNKDALWWTNGTINKRSVECPGEGFVKGRTCNYKVVPKFWYNNGERNIRLSEDDVIPAGFVRGKC